ncbi:CIA30 family protein [Dokdonia ponticola]|uniref:CIA30 family protein n=1 Tax=Dokdonia ponticola TaxID=2041041 RepID=A0ABV9I181_9FLAO
MPPLKVVITIISLFLMTSTPYDIDFGTSCTDCDWFVVLDGVMGGRSDGTVTETAESIIFKGSISLENNGGFASYRSPYRSYDLSPFKEVHVRYKSTGQNFALTLANYRRFYKPNFKASLPGTNGEWKEVVLPPSSFKKYRLGNMLSGNPSSEELKNVIRLGLISNDKKASDFMMEIDYIRFK